MLPRIAHIPTPGDHYSPQSGSSYCSVIFGLAKEHAAHGGETDIIVGRGTQVGYPPYTEGRCVEVSFGSYPRREYRLLDALSGAAGGERQFKWKCYRPLLNAIDPECRDWVFIHGEPAIVVPLRASRPQIHIALYCHYDLFRWYTSREVRKIAAAADVLICVSRHMESYVNRKANRALSNVFTVLNGVDLEQFNVSVTAVDDPPSILFVGRMCEDKGPHLLLQAAAILRRKGVRFRLRLVGSQYLGHGSPVSDYEIELRRLAQVLGDAVEFTPFVPRSAIHEVYNQSSIFCAPSTWDEPFGLTLVEAMATGLPSVVSKKGAFPEIAGTAALFFDPPNIDQLADQLEKLICDRSRRESLGKQARLRAETFSWKSSYSTLGEALRIS